MANVTYLLGAGASYHALPIVTQFKEKIELVIKELIARLADLFEDMNRLAEKYDSAPIVAIQDLVNLSEGCKNHRDIDIFAGCEQ